MPLCKECAAKIDLPGGTLDTMRVADLETYMACYEENKPLRDTFTETMRRSFGFLSGSLVLDTDHRLLRFNAGDSFVFGPENLKSFRITEDGRPLFEARDGVLYCHYSDVPDRVTAMQPAIDRFYMDVHDYERMEEMDRRMHRDDDDHRPVRFRPTFDMKEPVEKFAVELTLAHPYWHSFREEIGAPDFDSYNPSAAEYLNEYEDDVNGLHELAAALGGNGQRHAPQLPGHLHGLGLFTGNAILRRFVVHFHGVDGVGSCLHGNFPGQHIIAGVAVGNLQHLPFLALASDILQ